MAAPRRAAAPGSGAGRSVPCWRGAKMGSANCANCANPPTRRDNDCPVGSRFLGYVQSGAESGEMKRRIFSLVSILVGIVLAMAMIEGAAIAWLYVEDGRYTPAAELFERTQNTYVRDLMRGSDCRYVDALYPHPYLAFVHHGNPPC